MEIQQEKLENIKILHAIMACLIHYTNSLDIDEFNLQEDEDHHLEYDLT